MADKEVRAHGITITRTRHALISPIITSRKFPSHFPSEFFPYSHITSTTFVVNKRWNYILTWCFQKG